MNKWTENELICAVGTLMVDLRNDFGHNYAERLGKLLALLNRLAVVAHISYKYVDREILADVAHDLVITNDVLANLSDGRIFRDECEFYGGRGKERRYTEGETDRVRTWLRAVMSYPEMNWTKEDGE